MFKKSILIGSLIGLVSGIIVFFIIFLSYFFNLKDLNMSLSNTANFLRGLLMFLSIGIISGLGYSVYIINRLFMVSGTRMLKTEINKNDKYFSEEEEAKEKKLLKDIDEERKRTKNLILFYSGLITSYMFLFVLTLIIGISLQFH